MGYNSELTYKGLKQIRDNNNEYVKSFTKEKLKLIDDTLVVAFNSNNSMRGYRFDQIILFDDFRWMIYDKRREDINLIKEMYMNITCVPEEFQIIKYEDIG